MENKNKLIDHKKKIVTESIEYYQDSIEFYNEVIADNKEHWLRPDISDKRRHAHKLLIEAAEEKKRECQKEIERLLND